MAKIDFINQLKALGCNPQEPVADKVYFEYIVPVGSNEGKKVLLGFTVTNDFPLNCPTGPHFKPIESGWIEHPQNIHDWGFGNNWDIYPNDNSREFYQTGWRYWSRPCHEWPASDRTVKFYMSHIRKILTTV